MMEEMPYIGMSASKQGEVFDSGVVAESQQELSEPKQIEKGFHAQCQCLVTCCETHQIIQQIEKNRRLTGFSLSRKKELVTNIKLEKSVCSTDFDR